MDIQAYTTLSETQKAQVLTLEQQCFDEEALENRSFLSNELNFDKQAPCFFLGYEGNTLTSFLVAFFPEMQEVELNGCTHPSFQRQGRFTQLVNTALQTYGSFPFKKALFQCELNAHKARTYLKTRYPAIDRTEYVMVLLSETWQPDACSGNIERISLENRHAAETILAREREMTQKNSEEEVDFLLSQPDREAYLYQYRGEYLGMVNTEEEAPGSVMLHGLVIAQGHRGKGHGKRLMTHLLNELCLRYPSITLEVDSKNPPALTLYRNLGFKTKNHVDYHSLIL